MSNNDNKSHSDAIKSGIERRNRVLDVVDEHLEELTETQVASALGVRLAKGTPVIDPKTGEVTEVKGRVYIQKPDTKAAEYLINQAIGKPKDLLELSGEVKGIVDLVKGLEEDEDDQ